MIFFYFLLALFSSAMKSRKPETFVLVRDDQMIIVSEFLAKLSADQHDAALQL